MGTLLVKGMSPKEASEMRQRVIKAMRSVWNCIGEDCFKNEMGGHDETVLLSRATVAELVLDADRTKDKDKEAFEFFQKLSPNAKKEIIIEAFPAKKYGY